MRRVLSQSSGVVVALLLLAALCVPLSCAGDRSAPRSDVAGAVGDGPPVLDAPPPLADAATPTPDGPQRDVGVQRDGAVARDTTVDAPPKPDAPPPPIAFGDVPTNHLHYAGIQWVAAKGLMNGCAPGATPPRFCPDAVLTRAQAAVTLVVARHGQSFNYNQTPVFTDVPTTHWAFKYAQKLFEMQITSGCAANRYCPDDATKRSHGAVFLVRLIFGNTFSSSATPYFTDVPASHSAFKYVQKLYEQKITQGCAASMYCPDRDLTRGEWATMLYRAKP